jgi:hypothetical protein
MRPRFDPEEQIKNAHSLDELVSVLETLFNHGFAVDEEGRLYQIVQRVAQENGLRFEIFRREHAPPHFHVRGADVDATFAILTCQLLSGTVDSRRKSIVEWWHKRSLNKLIQFWNQTRPSDCPVGPIEGV